MQPSMKCALVGNLEQGQQAGNLCSCVVPRFKEAKMVSLRLQEANKQRISQQQVLLGVDNCYKSS